MASPVGLTSTERGTGSCVFRPIAAGLVQQLAGAGFPVAPFTLQSEGLDCPVFLLACQYQITSIWSGYGRVCLQVMGIQPYGLDMVETPVPVGRQLPGSGFSSRQACSETPVPVGRQLPGSGFSSRQACSEVVRT